MAREYESAIVPALARLGSPVVAVSGNHDSRPLMLAAARAGVIVLTRNGRLLEDGSTTGDPVVTVDGLEVAGFEDPLESASGTFEGRLLELKENGVHGRAAPVPRVVRRRSPSGPTSSSSTATGSRTRSSTCWRPRVGRRC